MTCAIPASPCGASVPLWTGVDRCWPIYRARKGARLTSSSRTNDHNGHTRDDTRTELLEQSFSVHGRPSLHAPVVTQFVTQVSPDRAIPLSVTRSIAMLVATAIGAGVLVGGEAPCGDPEGARNDQAREHAQRYLPVGLALRGLTKCGILSCWHFLYFVLWAATA